MLEVESVLDKAQVVPATPETQEIPMVLRDKRGRVVWKLPGNTPEENEQLGIRNIQARFLEQFPEFNELFPRGEDGKIMEEKREEAKFFIVEHLGLIEKFQKVMGDSKRSISYFQRNYRVALSKSFEDWGIQFDWNLPAPEGWLTRGFLKNQFGVSFGLIEKIATPFKQDHPEWFKKYLDSLSRPQEHYSPELVNLIREKATRYVPASEGWMTNGGLSVQLDKHNTVVFRVATEFREDHPEWFKLYLDRGGHTIEHYAPELVRTISKILNDKPRRDVHQKMMSSEEANEQLRRLLEE